MEGFTKVCTLDQLVKGAGVAALIDNVQVALFYLDNEVFALNNYDPIGHANVMSRGLAGDLKGQMMVASPLQKQHYNLKTGECMDVEGVSIPVYETLIEDGTLYVKVTG